MPCEGSVSCGDPTACADPMIALTPRLAANPWPSTILLLARCLRYSRGLRRSQRLHGVRRPNDTQRPHGQHEPLTCHDPMACDSPMVSVEPMTCPAQLTYTDPMTRDRPTTCTDEPRVLWPCPFDILSRGRPRSRSEGASRASEAPVRSALLSKERRRTSRGRRVSFAEDVGRPRPTETKALDSAGGAPAKEDRREGGAEGGRGGAGAHRHPDRSRIDLWDATLHRRPVSTPDGSPIAPPSHDSGAAQAQPRNNRSVWRSVIRYPR